MENLRAEMDLLLLGIGMVLCFLSLAFFSVAIVQRRKQRCEMELLLQRLDDALLQKKQGFIFNETLDSAISERLNKLTGLIERTNRRTEEEVSSIRELVSNISHQIKAPLANIMLYTAILQENLKEKEEKEIVNKVEAQAEKLDFFIKQLVKSSYAEIDMLRLMPEKSSVDEMIKRACQMMELKTLKKHILIRCQHTELFAVFDMKWTVEGIGNILDNAIKYSPEHSCIDVNIASYESFVCIQISDHGIGIKEEEQGLIFQRFYRSEDVKDQSGLGIGLYLSREIFLREGGYVKTESSKGSGAKFKVFLPLY